MYPTVLPGPVCPLRGRPTPDDNRHRPRCPTPDPLVHRLLVVLLSVLRGVLEVVGVAVEERQGLQVRLLVQHGGLPSEPLLVGPVRLLTPVVGLWPRLGLPVRLTRHGSHGHTRVAVVRRQLRLPPVVLLRPPHPVRGILHHLRRPSTGVAGHRGYGLEILDLPATTVLVLQSLPVRLVLVAVCARSRYGPDPRPVGAVVG